MAEKRHIGHEVLDALGLPAHQCTGLTMSFKPHGLVDVQATYYVMNGDPRMKTVAMLLRDARMVQSSPEAMGCRDGGDGLGA